MRGRLRGFVVSPELQGAYGGSTPGAAAVMVSEPAGGASEEEPTMRLHPYTVDILARDRNRELLAEIAREQLIRGAGRMDEATSPRPPHPVLLRALAIAAAVLGFRG